jgi:hypothetical protein
MQRLTEIKNRLEVIEAALAKQHPRYRADPLLSDLVTDLKDHVEGERKKIQKQSRRGELSELESNFIEPAINDVYLSALDRIRRGAKPSSEMNNRICETSTTLSYWLFQIQDYEGKQ